MKIVHAADLHIDSPFRGLGLVPETLPPLFQRATRGSFRNLIDLCLQQEAAILLLAGDIFDSDCGDPATGDFFVAEMARLREVGTRVVLVYGNHDAECHVMRQLRLPEHVQRFATGSAHTLVYEDLGVAIHGQSYAATAVWDNLARGYPAPVPELLNIGLLHTNAIRYLDDPLYAPCTVEELVDKGYAYWALGHIHWPRILHEEPWVVYAGNIQARYMEEAGPKGCVLIDADAQGIRSVEHVVLDTVRWAELRVRVCARDVWYEGLARVRASLKQARLAAGGRPLVARIILEGEGADYDPWFAGFVKSTSYESRLREIGRGLDWLWIEDVVVRKSAEPLIDASRPVCEA
ncbi:MAG: DNA repair exonuclease [Gammaproteobacteria bacterium]